MLSKFGLGNGLKYRFLHTLCYMFCGNGGTRKNGKINKIGEIFFSWGKRKIFVES